MAVACQTVPALDAFASGIIGFLDCQAQTLGAFGYQALAAPGSTASLVLTAMLTVLIALIGYRMLLGETPTLREGVLTFVKIGIVLAIATAWPAYQAVIYDVVLRSPADLVSEIGGAAGLPGAAGGLPARLDGVDRAFKTLSIYGVGTPPFDPTGQTAPVQVVPPLFLGFDTFALGASRVVFLAGALGGFALVRLAAGLLLALGPLFLAFLLFDSTRGLFEGWLRGLIAAALGALATAILLGVELALVEPWLADLVAQRAAGTAIVGVPEPLFATTVIFAVVLAGLLVMVGRVAFALRLPVAYRFRYERAEGVSDTRAGAPARLPQLDLVPADSRSRAAAVADSVAAAQRREEYIVQGVGPSGVGSRGIVTVAPRSSDVTAGAVSPLGQKAHRRTATRVSASAGARDRRT